MRSMLLLLLLLHFFFTFVTATEKGKCPIRTVTPLMFACVKLNGWINESIASSASQARAPIRGATRAVLRLR